MGTKYDFATVGDDQYGTEVFVFSDFGDSVTKQDLINEQKAYSCSCTHDCCGCQYASVDAEIVLFDKVRRLAILKQHWGKNV